MVRKATIGLLGAIGILSMSGAADADAETRLEREFDKWLVACVEPEGKENSCTLSQTFRGTNQNTKDRVFVFSWMLTVDQDGKEDVILRTPLGVELNKSVRITFPDTGPDSMGFNVCNRNGCFSRFGFESGWSEAMQRNRTASVEFAFRNGRDVNLEMELQGFSSAYAFYREQLGK